MYIFGEYSILQRWSSWKEGTGLQGEVLSLVTPSQADAGGPGPRGRGGVPRRLPHRARLPSAAVGEADGPQINGRRRELTTSSHSPCPCSPPLAPRSQTGSCAGPCECFWTPQGLSGSADHRSLAGCATLWPPPTRNAGEHCWEDSSLTSLG